MVVVSDTSSVSNLIQLDNLQLLNQLYGVVTIPPAVKRELYRIEDHARLLDQLDWIQVAAPVDQRMVLQLLDDLDLGESEAIVLAIEQKADYLMIDEYLGRKVARELNVKVIGVLGILILAKDKGLIRQVKPLIEKLQAIGFRLSKNLVESVLNQAGE